MGKYGAGTPALLKLWISGSCCPRHRSSLGNPAVPPASIQVCIQKKISFLGYLEVPFLVEVLIVIVIFIVIVIIIVIVIVKIKSTPSLFDYRFELEFNNIFQFRFSSTLLFIVFW